MEVKTNILNIKLKKAIPKTLKLYDYQIADIEQAVLGFSGPVFLGHEMGLGKTIIAICCLNVLNPSRALILCPASVKGVWESELEKWLLPKRQLQVLHTRRDKLDSLAEIVICSYDLAIMSPVSKMLCKSWALAIYDEAHCLGNLRSKRTKYILGNLWPLVSKPMFLSGSIHRDKIIQLYPIFGRIAPKVFGGYWDFARQYCYLEQGKWGTKVFGGKNLKKLKEVACKHFLIRRRKEEVLESLPEKIEQKVLVYLPEEEEKRQLQAKTDFAFQTEKAIDGEMPDKALATLREELGLKKALAAIDYIQELLQEKRDSEQDPCLVVYCYHRRVHRLLKNRIADVATVYEVTGETGGKDRTEAILSFQDKTNTPAVFLATFAAAEGITLTRASTVIFVEQSWSLAQNEQAIDRLHRIGQKNTVEVKILVAKNSLDEVVYNVYKQKAGIKRRVWG